SNGYIRRSVYAYVGMRSFLYRILLLCFVIIVQIGLIAIDASPLVVAMFLSLTALVAGVWMAYLHSRFLMAVTPVVISVLMATLAMKMFEPRLFVSASEKGWFPLSLFVSIPFYFYLSYLLEIEEKRRTFRANVIGFLRGVSEEIRRSTREHRDQGEIRHGGTELGSIDELQRGEAKEPEVISSTSDQKEQGTPKRDKRKIILD
ncbi:hypothetical protein ACPU7Z_004830, partial [Salmonella enterica subsp. enterica serovar Typhimurium]